MAGGRRRPGTGQLAPPPEQRKRNQLGIEFQEKRTVNHPSSATPNLPSLSGALAALPLPCHLQGTVRPGPTPRLTLEPPESVQSVPCSGPGGHLPLSRPLPSARVESLLTRGARGDLSPCASFSPVLLALRACWWGGTPQGASCYRAVLPSRSEPRAPRPLHRSAQSADWTAVSLSGALAATSPGLRRGRGKSEMPGSFSHGSCCQPPGSPAVAPWTPS